MLARRCGSGVFITGSEAISRPTPGIAVKRRAATKLNSAPWPRIVFTSCVRWRDPPLALARQHQSRLLIGRLRRHEAHLRPACGLAQRRRVGRIVLAARHIGLSEPAPYASIAT